MTTKENMVVILVVILAFLVLLALVVKTGLQSDMADRIADNTWGA